jgi:hypothetical protein
LSALARRRGDRSGALREIRRVFELASGADEDDPWWSYHTAQARNADDLITALIAPFASGRSMKSRRRSSPWSSPHRR